MGPDALREYLWAKRAVAALLARLQGLIKAGVKL
jgi:hypothetical protein